MHSKKKGKKERKTQRGLKKQNRKKERKKNEANMRSGHRPSPEDKVGVCLCDQSDDLSSQRAIRTSEETRRKALRYGTYQVPGIIYQVNVLECFEH